MQLITDSLSPSFLVAFPHLLDPNFRQSVVLLLRQSEEGAMGVVINRESTMLVSELCSDHQIPFAGEPAKTIRDGGPCQREQGIVLYGEEHADAEGEEVLHGLHLSASRGTLRRLCDLPRGRFQCFSGYAGWGPGQLDREIGEGAWLVAPADASTVLDVLPERIWSRCLARMEIDPSALVTGGGGLA